MLSAGFLRSFGTGLSMALVKFDLETGEPIRNEEGFCIRCSHQRSRRGHWPDLDDGQVRPAGSKAMRTRAPPKRRSCATCSRTGDAWFRTGDLMRKDESGFFYFVDRIGDTFRWKGENVSTTEVAATVCAYPGVIEAVVYGVTIPGTEGRAGMVAAVVATTSISPRSGSIWSNAFPSYARPLFLRILARDRDDGDIQAEEAGPCRASPMTRPRLRTRSTSTTRFGRAL